ncbi:MAG: valine--tRNA ligase [Phycisphaerae bacterium]|jgi:valyl-tRNA synthetase
MSSGGSYDPRAVESEIYRFWEEGGHFHATPDPAKRPFVIDIPLPNVTGALHLGHALNNTLQDILIRHKRMAGWQAMWMPGTDHAGIATQAVVERRLKEEQNLTRHELGRDGLVKKIWEWKEQYGGRILRQLRQIGCSCDWERTRFTLDDVCAKAVYEVFFQWFKAGLIYRGQRLVNWDAQLQTAVSDDEIFHETVKGHLWHYRYPILTVEEASGGSGGVSEEVARSATARATRDGAKLGVDYLCIATTRPETMLGDTALAVHPDDKRYRKLIGRHVLLPLQNRPIPIIGDDILVEMTFGTGCVKVTPGHDPNDYEFGLRHKVPMINILTPDGRINENGGAYRGLERYAARQKVVEDLQQLGLVEQIEDYETEIGHSDRSKTPIEPMLSEQWFVNMGDLAERAMEAVRDGRVQFFPQRYEKTYLDWLGEKRDWCISRQLWWGHRIPVWTKRDSALHFDDLDKQIPEMETTKSRSTITVRGVELPAQERREGPHTLITSVCVLPWMTDAIEALETAGYEQDPDVLDTWFSSALWPFSTLRWPDVEGNADLEYFHPTSVLITAREIITLWVARMVMNGLYFTGRVPFQHVHIHPNIQDGQGRRMSKSAGNGVDPVDIIEQYGTDALRFTMAQMDTETQDARLPVAYLCPHCGHLTPQATVVPQGKVPAQVHEAKCTGCHKPFATVWAPEEKKQRLGVAIDTSDRFEMGRNFCNKIWQAATGFVIPNLAGAEPRPLTAKDLELEDLWILSRLSACIAECDRRLARYQLSDVAATLYGFFWNELCDWYLELVKTRLFGRNDAGEVVQHTDASAGVARQVLAWVLDQSLRLLHPVLPFVTEAVWRQLNEAAPRRGVTELIDGEPALIAAAWPDANAWRRDPAIEEELEALQNVIKGLRDTLAWINSTRAAAKTPAIGKLPRAVIRASASLAAGLQQQAAVIGRLGRCVELEIGADVAKPAESATKVFAGVEVYVPIAGLADLEAERQRLGKQRDELQGHIQRLEAKLANEGFVAKAPPAVVQRERERLAELCEKLAAVDRNLAEVGT